MKTTKQILLNKLANIEKAIEWNRAEIAKSNIGNKLHESKILELNKIASQVELKLASL